MKNELIGYQKVYEGLSTDGIAAHITSSLLLWNRTNGKGTQNDCQLVINNLLRAYHRLKLNRGLYGKVRATTGGLAAKAKGSGYHLEHAIPIACVMWALLDEVRERDFNKEYDQVKTIIDSTMHVAYVTQNEHMTLNKFYSCSMLEGHEKYPWVDPWGRYVAAKVETPT